MNDSASSDRALRLEPEAAGDECYFKYLNALRESGATNMFGARPWLMKAFPALSGRQAPDILKRWMYSDRSGS